MKPTPMPKKTGKPKKAMGMAMGGMTDKPMAKPGYGTTAPMPGKGKKLGRPPVSVGVPMPMPMPGKPTPKPKPMGMAYGGMAEKTMGMAKGGMTKKAPAKKGKK
jgi:hypothetical protein